MRLSISQEAPVPQAFSSLTHSTIVTQSMSSLAADACRKRVARTLSRGFWQQKNFHAHRLRVSTPLAKSGFLRESPRLIRKCVFFTSRDASSFMVNDRFTRAAYERRRR
jgi:hypothetical protein